MNPLLNTRPKNSPLKAIGLFSIASALCIAAALTPSGGALATETQATTSGSLTAPNELATKAPNLDLVSNLQGEDECLWRNSVYPSGGTGYQDSSLPYDGMPDFDKAFLTVRAEVLRNNTTTVMDAILEQDGTTMTIVGKSSLHTETPESLLTKSNIGLEMLEKLGELGISMQIRTGDVPSILEVCETQDYIRDIKDASGNPIPSYVASDATTGSVTIEASKSDLSANQAALSSVPNWVQIEYVENISDTSRLADYAPWNGGARVNGNCTTGFRINSSHMLTADHCPGSSFTNGGNWVGNGASSLASANVDAKLITGSSYSNRVWVGPVSTNSSLPGSDVYPYYTIPNGNLVLMSGSFSGQSNLTFQGNANGNGCMTTSSGYWCQIIKSQASAKRCIGGDSGGPVAVYDPASNRLISLGLIKAKGGNVNTTHSCYFTNMMAIVYLYGGATIG